MEKIAFKTLAVLCVLASVSVAYNPDKFSSGDNVSVDSVATKLADGVGEGLVATKDNANSYVQDFIILVFMVIVYYIIRFGRSIFK